MDALFELTDFDETKPAEPVYLVFECGLHRQHAEWEAHLSDCLAGECPACGQPMTHWFDFHVNHGPAQRPAWSEGLCSKQHLLMNHCRYIAGVLDGHQITHNCHAVAHHGTHKAHGYFAKGAPLECAAAEWAEKYAWLTAHRVPSDRIAHPVSEPAHALIEAARAAQEGLVA